MSSEVDIEGLQDATAAQRAVAVVDWVAHENLSAGLAEAQVPAGQKQHGLALVLADNTFLPLFLLLQQLPWVLSSCRLILVESLSAPGRGSSAGPDLLLFLCFRNSVLSLDSGCEYPPRDTLRGPRSPCPVRPAGQL